VSYEGGTQTADGPHRGQSLVEYALIIAFVAVLAIASLLIFRPEISSVLSNLSASV
jgi:Flp pilus assembly pilin Flp